MWKLLVILVVIKLYAQIDIFKKVAVKPKYKPKHIKFPTLYNIFF